MFISATTGLTVAIVCSIALCFMIPYCFKLYKAEQAGKSDVGNGKYIAEVRIHINSFSQVVYCERHASAYSAKRIAKLRAIEFLASPEGKALSETAEVKTDMYIASPDQSTTFRAVWPAAGTSLAFN